MAGHPLAITTVFEDDGIALSFKQTERVQFEIVEYTIAALQDAGLVPSVTELSFDGEEITIFMQPDAPIRADLRTTGYQRWADARELVVWTMTTSIQASHDLDKVVKRIGELM